MMISLTFTGEVLNDCYLFNADTKTWVDLSSSLKGITPAPRWYHGFAAVDKMIYVFGGSGAADVGKFLLLIHLNALWKRILLYDNCYEHLGLTSACVCSQDPP